MKVLRKCKRSELSNDFAELSTTAVQDWRHRSGSWQRRSRLVAREYKWSDPTRQDLFSASTASSQTKLLAGLAVCNPQFQLWSIDVKDAFLQVPQRTKVFVRPPKGYEHLLEEDEVLVLERLLPGQRAGTKEWSLFLKEVVEKEGYETFLLSPNLYVKKDGKGEVEGAILVHVDDIQLAATPQEGKRLKTKLEARPDAQHCIRELASCLVKPTEKQYRQLEHLICYLKGTAGYAVKLPKTTRGVSVLHPDWENIQQSDDHLLEVFTDSDWGGNRTTRKSVSVAHMYWNGTLIHTLTRTQKAVALSSCEAEYVAMTTGASEGVFLKNCIEFLAGKRCRIILRCDSSSARAFCHRQGVGGVRHISCNFQAAYKMFRVLMVQAMLDEGIANPGQGFESQGTEHAMCSNGSVENTQPEASWKMLLMGFIIVIAMIAILLLRRVWKRLKQEQQEIKERMDRSELSVQMLRDETRAHAERLIALENGQGSLESYAVSSEEDLERLKSKVEDSMAPA
eukprot:s1906_g14.t2